MMIRFTPVSSWLVPLLALLLWACPAQQHHEPDPQPLTCRPDQASCDGLADNGCETELLHDPNHCGGCANACGADTSCVLGTCVGTFTEVVMGWGFACALSSDGGVVCWGSQLLGQLGQGVRATACGPVSVPLPLGAVSLATSRDGACAVTSDGGVYCWGTGLPTIETSATGAPTLVDGLPPVSRITLGEHHACAVLVDGRVACWGANESGQLGDGTRTPHETPTVVPGLNDVVDVQANGFVTCALTAPPGRVACWGNYWTGCLPGMRSDHGPTWVPDLEGVTELVHTDDRACVLVDDGASICWRAPICPESGEQVAPLWEPETRFSGAMALAVVPGWGRVICADTDSGGVECWEGELSDSSGSAATLVQRPNHVTDLALGYAWASNELAACAIDELGAVVCVGPASYPWGSLSRESAMVALEGTPPFLTPEAACEGLDADEDGIGLAEDRCPTEAETYNGVEDGDGCPDEGDVLVEVDEEAGRIRLITPVEFEFDDDVIRPQSYRTLDQLASLLQYHERIPLLEIQGHYPDGNYSRRISRDRAEAVAHYLIQGGVDRSRLETNGYGDSLPIYDATGPDADRNRRIELVIRLHPR